MVARELAALKELIDNTIEALEEAEGLPLAWPVQKIIREQIARAYEAGRLSLPAAPARKP